VRPFAVLSKNTYSAPICLPIGPVYLATLLKSAGYEVSIIDAIGEDVYRITRTPCKRYNLHGLLAEEIIARLDPDVRIIGISMMFSQEWVEHRALINALRAARPYSIIVAGGEHATAVPEYLLRDCPAIDYVVTGEGELTFLELCHSVFAGHFTDEIGGLCSLGPKGEFINPGLSRRIAEVDDLPSPDWALCPVENYFIDNWTVGLAMGRNMPIIATRGCPYQCTFCSSPGMWTTRYIMRDPKKVVDEIEANIEKYRVNSFDFFDLTAIVKKEWIRTFCAELKARGIDIAWQLPSGTRSEALDHETLKAIYDAGCRYLVYAPESGSEESLQLIKKKVRLERLCESVRDAIAVGHTIKINLIIGFPHERLHHVMKTLMLAWRMAILGVHDCNLKSFTPYPGSELHDELRLCGIIPELNDDYFRSLISHFDFTIPSSYSRYVPAWQLLIARNVANIVFYLLSYGLHPGRLLRLFREFHNNRFQPANLLEQRVSDFLARRRWTKAASSRT
jgi:radical SAM superfamily enzyme YgiQ (UPF0313 family)